MLYSLPVIVAQMNAPIPLTAAQFLTAPLGSRVRLVVRVESRARNEIRGDVLDRRSEDTYAETKVHLRLYDATDTPVIMGGANDVRPGAVVYVEAVATGKGSADAKRLTVLTQYVHVTH